MAVKPLTDLLRLQNCNGRDSVRPPNFNSQACAICPPKLPLWQTEEVTYLTTGCTTQAEFQIACQQTNSDPTVLIQERMHPALRPM